MKTRKLLFTISMILALTLSACLGWLTALKATIDLTVNANGSWELTMKPTYSKEDVEANAGQIEPAIQDQLNTLKSEGITGTWRKASTDAQGNVTYRITLSGDDVAELNEYIFEDSAALTKQEVNKKMVWQLRLTPNNNLFADAGEWVFTLHAGKVLNSNGDQAKAGTVVWTYAGQQLSADFQTGGRTGWLLPVLIGVGVLVLAGVVVLLVVLAGKQKKARQAGTALPLPGAPQGANNCVKCGNPLADGIIFCPKCGTMREVKKQAPAPAPVPAQPAMQPPVLQPVQPPAKYFCANCGNELAEGIAFCPKCGTKRTAGAPAAKPPKLPRK